jgi:hypothetical protein
VRKSLEQEGRRGERSPGYGEGCPHSFCNFSFMTEELEFENYISFFY